LPTPYVRGELAAWRLQRARDFIEDRPAEHVSLAKVITEKAITTVLANMEKCAERSADDARRQRERYSRKKARGAGRPPHAAYRAGRECDKSQ
jgi:hypothetical protein